MDTAFDHVVVVVPELPAAVRAFSAAGFTVLAGGRHDVIPTENALIVFADGGYLELLAPRDAEARDSLRIRSERRGWDAEVRRSPAVARRFLPNLVGPPGVADWVLGASDLRPVAAALRRVDQPASGPVPMARERNDGTRLAWELLLPLEPWIPFFIRDVTPRSSRVPEDEVARRHANGATGVAQVHVHVPTVAAAALCYADLFGVPPRVREGATVLSLAGVEVVLEEGTPAGARRVVVRGAKELPAEVEALGVRCKS
jgi:hypothetical protein